MDVDEQGRSLPVVRGGRNLTRRRFLGATFAGAVAVLAGLIARRDRVVSHSAVHAPNAAGREETAPSQVPSGQAGDSELGTQGPTAGESPAEAVDGSGADGPGPAAVTSLVVVCRDALGLPPAREDARVHTIERLTLHHTAVTLEHNRHAPSRLRGHQGFHQNQGWPDIAYHYGVDLAGNVYELRDPSMPGDTFTDYDPTGHFLVVCEGNYSEQQPSDAMLASVASLFAYAADHYGVDLAIAGHRDYASTACPGDALYARLDELTTQAQRLQLDAPPRLARSCGPGASAHVASVESGG